MFVICSISQGMKSSKHGLFVFPPKETIHVIWRRHYSICQSCCSMTSKRSLDWFLKSSSSMKGFHPSVRLTKQKPRAFVSIGLYPFDKPIKSLYFRSLLFLFCLRVFILRTYENRSTSTTTFSLNLEIEWRQLSRFAAQMTLVHACALLSTEKIPYSLS